MTGRDLTERHVTLKICIALERRNKPSYRLSIPFFKSLRNDNSIPSLVKWSELLPVLLISQRVAVRLHTTLPERRLCHVHHPLPKLAEARLRLPLMKTE